MELAKVEPGQLRFDGRTAIVTGAGGNPSLGVIDSGAPRLAP